MTLKEGRAIRHEIETHVRMINEKFDSERTIDHCQLTALREYCERVRPQFVGKFGNVGGKVTEMATAAAKARKTGELSELVRALSGIDIALLHHESPAI